MDTGLIFAALSIISVIFLGFLIAFWIKPKHS